MISRTVLSLGSICLLASIASAVPTATPATAPAPAATPEPLAIIVYDQADFKGNALTLNKPVPDLAAYRFDNKVASLMIKGAGDWVLCENRNYTGRCARVQLQAGNLKLFQLNDRVSSLYPVPAPAAPAATTPAAPAGKPN